MMVDIPDSTFTRLQKHARPFIDTPASVIERALDALERVTAADKPEAITTGSTKLLEFPSNIPPNLTHTRVLTAKFGGHAVQPKWNSLLRFAHEVGFKKTGSYEGLQNVTIAKIQKGAKTDEGFQPLGNLGFSI